MWSRTMLRVTQKAAARRRKGQGRGTGATGQGDGLQVVPSEQGAERRGPEGGSPRGKRRRSGAKERARPL